MVINTKIYLKNVKFHLATNIQVKTSQFHFFFILYFSNKNPNLLYKIKCVVFFFPLFIYLFIVENFILKIVCFYKSEIQTGPKILPFGGVEKEKMGLRASIR